MRTLFYLTAGFILSSFFGLGMGGGFSYYIPGERPPKATRSDIEFSLLSQHTALQQEMNLQDANITHRLRKALAIAEVLFNFDGTFNIGECQSVKSTFLSAQPEEYEINMAKVLDQLDASWEPFFDSIKAPQDPHSANALTLRALFSLGATQPLTDRHAKVAVLTTMLTPYHQSPVGNCFAACSMLLDNKEFLRQTASDYASLIMNGCLIRPGNDGPDYFFYLPSLADEDLKKPFTLSIYGTFGDPLHMLSDSPGLRSARDVMGGSYKSCSDTELLSILLNGSDQSIQVTPEQVIEAMARVVSIKTSKLSVDDLRKLGHYAFSSQSYNPVLCGIEAAFASIAEERTYGSIRADINASVEQAMKPMWAKLIAHPGSPEFHTEFINNFNRSYQLIYNFNISLEQPSSGGISTSKGFQLYQRDLHNPACLGAQITTPQDFEQLVLDALAATQTSLSSIDAAEAMGRLLTDYVKTSNFLANVLWAYDPSVLQELDPVSNYQKLSKTPMLTWDTDTIDKTSYEKTRTTCIPLNAKELISWCMDLSQRANVDLAPMHTSQYTFHFTPKNPDLTNFVSSKTSSAYWLQKTLIVPGMQVATRQIDAITQNNLSQAMWPLISDLLFGDDTNYQNLVEQLSAAPLSLQAYSQKLLAGINSLLKSNGNQSQIMASDFDAVLISCLSPADRTILEQSAVRFAMTNANEELKGAYFCAYFNPRTEQIGFGSILEDKTNLQPMDESSWVNNQQWDVDLTPLPPLAVGQ